MNQPFKDSEPGEHHDHHDVHYHAHSERDHEDEIDLFDLWDDFVSNISWFVAGLLVCVALATAYLYVVKPVYEVTSVIKPANERDLVALNVPQLAGIFSLGVDAAFEHSKRAMLSKEYHLEFYRENLAKIKEIDGLYNPQLTLSQNFAGFDKLLSIALSNDKKDAEKFIKLTFQLTDAQAATDLLNAYMAFALQSRLTEIKETLESKRLVRLNKLEYDASLIRDKYYSNKTQRKLKLVEAQRIAKSVGQIDSIYSNVEMLGGSNPPLYLHGYKVLAAEEKALNQRKLISDDLPYGEEHFIGGLSNILFEINQLKNLSVNYSEIKISQLDELAVVPIGSVKPKKLLVMVLSVVAGGFLGLMLALLVAAYKRHKKRT